MSLRCCWHINSGWWYLSLIAMLSKTFESYVKQLSTTVTQSILRGGRSMATAGETTADISGTATSQQTSLRYSMIKKASSQPTIDGAQREWWKFIYNLLYSKCIAATAVMPNLDNCEVMSIVSEGSMCFRGHCYSRPTPSIHNRPTPPWPTTPHPDVNVHYPLNLSAEPSLP